ncbi:MAG: UbiA family prenyltransferase [Armatimonadota bacterium]
MTDSSQAVAQPRLPAPRRWWMYQRERFPLFGHGPLVLAFSLSAVCFSSLLRGQTAFPKLSVVAVAFFGSFCFFLQLRLADEFKDAEEDARYRPYRPVPRGLVTLRELGWLWVGTALLQLALTLWLAPPLAFWLFLTWAYLALMSKEFFVGDWLRAHPFTYLWTHMAIMPLIDVYTSGTEWVSAQAALPHGLFWFLIASYFNGMVIEVGRKIRAPEDEETGVQTYSVIWGRRGAVLAWWSALLLTSATALLAAARIGFVLPVAGLLGCAFLVTVFVGWRYLRNPAHARARFFEPLSGIWTLLLYLGLGVIPLLVRR